MNSSCSICYEDIEETNVCSLNCGHTFHFKCIMELYASKQKFSNNCPLCRKSIYEQSSKIDAHLENLDGSSSEVFQQNPSITISTEYLLQLGATLGIYLFNHLQGAENRTHISIIYDCDRDDNDITISNPRMRIDERTSKLRRFLKNIFRR